MKRRNFIVSSGVALGGASAAIGLLQEPATALDFTLDEYDVGSKNVSNLEDVNEVRISFDSFSLGTQYLDTSKKLTVQIDLDLKDKDGSVTSSSRTYEFSTFSNGDASSNGFDEDSFTDGPDSSAIGVSNVGDNVNFDYYKNDVFYKDLDKWATYDTTGNDTADKDYLDVPENEDPSWLDDSDTEKIHDGSKDLVTYLKRNHSNSDYTKLESSIPDWLDKYENKNNDVVNGGDDISSITDSEKTAAEKQLIYSNIVVKANLTVTVSHDDLSSDKVHNQRFYISEDPYGLYDVVTRYGEASNLFNQYETQILKDSSNDIFDGSNNVTYLDGLLSFHVASTSGFVTSSKKMEAIARDSENNRVTRESYINGDSPVDNLDDDPDADDVPYTYEGGYEEDTIQYDEDDDGTKESITPFQDS